MSEPASNGPGHEALNGLKSFVEVKSLFFFYKMKLKEANGLLPRQMRPLDVDYSSTNGSSGRMKVEVSERN